MSQWALVTGSAKGIGRAIALELASKGYHIVVHYRSSQNDAAHTVQLVQDVGVQAKLLQADLNNPEQLEGLLATPAPQVLVNNIGDYTNLPILATDAATWDHMLYSNLTLPVRLSQWAAASMQQQGGGCIVQIGFVGASKPQPKPYGSAYAIAKGALWTYTQTLAQALAPSGVRVNMVSPGVVDTSITKPWDELPMRRCASVQELAKAVGYMADNPYVTGQHLEVAGGWLL